MLSLVSVITPLFNSEKYIQDCINSVISQTYSNWEMIIVDDCSSDKSIEEVEKNKDQRIKIIKLSANKGAGYARNVAIEQAKGEYIAFLDADDLWDPNKLQLQINFMKDNNVLFSFTSFGFIDEQGQIDPKTQMALPFVDYNKMLRNNYIGCLTAVYNCSKLGKVYMPEFRKRQDWGLWLKLLKKTNNAKSLKAPLAYYRVGNDSLSKNKISLLKSNFEFYKDHLGYSFFISLYKMSLFLFSHFIYKNKYIK